ncbi:casein kinase substrate phosphoprotein PP28-domain-containing protein [Suillus clintonianus]|uniref:casein kinase substrate phosphoprotein PP28-domain-containing protein n=1 Tax=Suillus clintonianus TaxID=1904413 RepID=UPI001B86E98C|nr:casein kinase substrate phosphoprotein PP28-domain-containing protein [Suillus clintonianus]KAG2131658.1 casein kinase substrate phosphoprotein PP28-domain-containing protein [Suillus clintonianus]
MVRGTGKFKTKRGGGRNFSKHLEIDENGTAVSLDKRWAPRGQEGEADSDEDNELEEEEEEEDDEEEEGEGEEASGSAAQPELSRAERKALKKKQLEQKQPEGEDEADADLINPNHVEKKMNISDLGAPRELTRREREAKEKQEAKDRYWKLHLAGKTDEAKSDLARLRKIKEEREAAQAKRKAEAEAKAAEIEAKRKAAEKKRT